MSVYSQATNGTSKVQSTVDSSTGLYNHQVSLLSINALDSNEGSVKRSFALSYSCMSSSLTSSLSPYGIGWSLDGITTYSPTESNLSLSTGEQFQTCGFGKDGFLCYKDRKTVSFDAKYHDSDYIIVYHKDGVLEVLRAFGSNMFSTYQMTFPNGETYWLDYAIINDSPYLSSITDSLSNVMLNLEYNDTALTRATIYRGIGNAARSFNISTQVGPSKILYKRMDSYSRFAPEDAPATSVYLEYKTDHVFVENYVLLTNANFGNVANDTVMYSDVPHKVMQEGVLQYIPRVESFISDPGCGQKVLTQNYTYPDENNFLGYPNVYSSDDYKDTLYAYGGPDAFSYSVSIEEDSGNGDTRVTTRTFNTYHLMTSQVIMRDNCVTLINQMYPCDADENKDKPFDEQPAETMNPSKITNSYYKVNDNGVQTGNKLSLISTFEYDKYGNMKKTTSSSGVSDQYEMYDKAGDETCPSDPFNRFDRYIKKHTRTSVDGSQEKVETFQYISRKAITQTDVIKVNHVSCISNIELMDGEDSFISLEIEYVDDEDSIFTHNQFSNATMSMYDEKKNPVQSICDFTYSVSKDNSTVSTTTKLTGHDSTFTSSTSTRVVYTGLLLELNDRNGSVCKNTYNAAGDVLTSTKCAGTDFEDTCTYEHQQYNESTNCPTVVCTDAFGVKKLLCYDGRNNSISKSQTAPPKAAQSTNNKLSPGTGSINLFGSSIPVVPMKTETGSTETFYVTYEQFVDGFGNIITESESDYDNDGNLLYSAKVTNVYDGWGLKCQSQLSDSLFEMITNDPTSLSTMSTRVALDGEKQILLASQTVTMNLFKSPYQRESTRIDGSKFRTTFECDGFGRLSSITSAVGQKLEVLSYDRLDRLVKFKEPVGRTVQFKYPSFSPMHELESITLCDSDSIIASQTFDGIMRKTSTTIGGRTTTRKFSGSKGTPDEITTPAKNTISFVFNKDLYNLPDSVGQWFGEKGDKENAASFDTFTYGTSTADGNLGNLLSAENSVSKLSVTYSPEGRISSRKAEPSGVSEAETRIKSASFLGKPISTEFSTANSTVSISYKYDTFGRLTQKQQGDVTIILGYDIFGRPSEEEVSNDSGTSQKTSITYDDLNRETTRTIVTTLSPGSKFTFSQDYEYDNCNKLISRKTYAQNNLTLDESFSYDDGNRLSSYKVADGYEQASLPTTMFGIQFTEQNFEYGERDEIKSVSTYIPSEKETNVATYESIEGNPCMVKAITNTASTFPASLNFQYDEDGNITDIDIDGKTISMSYSVSGRLTSYKYDNKETEFSYDALQRLIKDGTRTRYLSDGNVLLETDSASEENAVYFVRSGTHVVAEQKKESTVFIGCDSQLSAVTSSSNEVNTMSYGAHGAGPISTRTGYCGEIKLAEHPVYPLGNGTRVYFPDLQLITTPDSFVPFVGGGINPYMYCRGNPMNALDHSGHDSQPPGLIADMSLNVFSLLVDLIALGISIALFASGGGALAGLAILSALLGVASDTCGIASDGWTMSDNKNGTDHSTREKVLGGMSALFGVGSMITGGVEHVNSLPKSSKAYAKRADQAQFNLNRREEEYGHVKGGMDKRNMSEKDRENVANKYEPKIERERKSAEKYTQKCEDIREKKTNDKVYEGKKLGRLSSVSGLDFDSINYAANKSNPMAKRIARGAWCGMEVAGQVSGYLLLGNYVAGVISSHEQSNDELTSTPPVDDGMIGTVTTSIENNYPMS